MLDFDLAELYGVETRVLNQAVKRNIKRFPPDFMIQINKKEWDSLISQIVISKKSKRGGTRKLPFAFTEHGIAMLSSVLNSEKAIEINTSIIRIFIIIRKYELSHKNLTEKLIQLGKKYNKQFKERENELGLMKENKENSFKII